MKPEEKGTHDDVVTGGVGSVLEVQPDEVLGQSPIAHLVNLVEDEVEQVESRDQSGRQVDVGGNGQFGVVPRVDGVGSCEDGSSGV